MKTIFSKLFCKHRWVSHATSKHNWVDKQVIGTSLWNPETLEITRTDTTEVLICSECGKIIKITY